MATIEELKSQARNLGFQNVAGMTKEELEIQIEKLQKIHDEGFRRLQFDPITDQILSNETNREILSKQATDPVDTKQKAIDKLKGYRLVEDMDNLLGRTWYRYINKYDGILRTGGFVLKNDEEFIALKNVSKRFTFSIKKNNVYLFEKVKGGFIPPELQPFLDKEPGNRYVLLSKDLDTMLVDTSISGIARKGGVGRSTIQRVIKLNKKMVKNYHFMRLNQEDIDELNRIIGTIEFDNLDPNVVRIINNYY